MRSIFVKKLSALIFSVSVLLVTQKPLCAQETVIYQSDYTTWYIYDESQYNTYKANIDDIIDVLDRAIPCIEGRLGVELPLPINVHIQEGDGWGGWAGGGEVGYTIGCFRSQGGMDWVRGVVIGEVVNVATGTVASEWPRDWWVNGVWYFPGMVVVDVLAEVEGEAASLKWETDEHYPDYPVYILFKGLKDDLGWEVYQDLMDLVEEDDMSWNRQGFGENPSRIRTSYVIAYISMVVGENMGQDFIDAEVSDVDIDEIQDIMETRQRLVAAEDLGHDVSTAWSAFRNADYSTAVDILDELGITATIQALSPSLKLPDAMTVYTLNGQTLFSGPATDIRNIPLKTSAGPQAVIVRYKLNGEPIYSRKILLYSSYNTH